MERSCDQYAEELLDYLWSICPMENFTPEAQEHLRRYAVMEMCFMFQCRDKDDAWWNAEGGGRAYWQCRVRQLVQKHMRCEDRHEPIDCGEVQGAINRYVKHVRSMALRLQRMNEARVFARNLTCDDDTSLDPLPHDGGPPFDVVPLRDCLHTAGLF